MTTTPASGYGDQEITGTWPTPSSVSGWNEIYVAIPSYGAWDTQADYQINQGGTDTQSVVINQAWQENTWVPLGTFYLGSGASVSLSNVAYSNLGRDIAWNAVAFVPSRPLTDSYVAMGDSYSSGEGLSPYLPNSSYNYDPDGVPADSYISACNRSADQSYSSLVDIPGTGTTFAQDATPGSGVEESFLACSGEYSSEMDPAALDSKADGGTSSFGQVPQKHIANTPWTGPSSGDQISLAYSEAPQMDVGTIGPNTTLVTITAGGDDVGFASVLADCVKHPSCLTGTIPGDGKPLDKYEPEVIEALKVHLEQLYADIAAQAPSAMIVVLGYPMLFDGVNDIPTHTLGCADVGLTSGRTNWMNKMGGLLDQEIGQAVSDVEVQDGDENVVYVDPNDVQYTSSPATDVDPFYGHRICNVAGAGAPSDAYLNGITLGLPYGPGSFHPTPAGQQELATLVNDCTAGLITGCTESLEPGSVSRGGFRLHD